MDKVLEAERTCRKATFDAMLPFIKTYIDDAQIYVSEFCAKHDIPDFEIVRPRNTFYIDPKTIYVFKLTVSDKLYFTVSTQIYLAQDGELYSYVLANICMNNIVFDGCFFIKNEEYENYVQNVKDACQACLDKYHEVHEKLRDFFF